MEEDFIIEEESEGANNRPFLIAVGVAIAIFILAALCAAAVLLQRGPSADEIAAIETQNAIIEVTNAAVTQTISAMETEAARPTDTPEPTATNTPTTTPTSTSTPTETPVVPEAEEEEEAAATATLSGTIPFELGEEADTPTPIAAPAAEEEALPQTGVETWGVLVAAFVLVVTLVAARRLRSS